MKQLDLGLTAKPRPLSATLAYDQCCNTGWTKKAFFKWLNAREAKMVEKAFNDGEKYGYSSGKRAPRSCIPENY